MNKVENLAKVTLHLEAGTTADRMHPTPTALEFEFIFGIGPGGMCPFEYQLVNKAAGEEIVIQVKKEELYPLFEHLHPPIMNLFEEHDVLHLKIKILRIEKPENTEIIKALSEMASHHHDCDCGCGC
jgi:FKBP-type peptidyl-prolyl cis-trans isomerase (trigger factor)